MEQSIKLTRLKTVALAAIVPLAAVASVLSYRNLAPASIDAWLVAQLKSPAPALFEASDQELAREIAAAIQGDEFTIRLDHDTGYGWHYIVGSEVGETYECLVAERNSFREFPWNWQPVILMIRKPEIDYDVDYDELFDRVQAYFIKGALPPG